MSNLISVVIPCYNCANSIERAVVSVHQQTLQSHEIILVDDASKDDTLDILKSLQKNYGDHWLKIITLEKNSGPAIARNLGWNSTNGDYVAFLDADEVWHPEKLAFQCSWIQKRPTIALCGHNYRVFKSEESIDFEPLPKKLKTKKITRSKLLLQNPFRTSSVLLRRDIKYRFSPDLRYSQDYYLWLEIVLEGYEAVILNFPTVYSFKPLFGGGGQTLNIRNGKLAEALIMKKLLKDKKINYFEYYFLTKFHLLKYYRRFILVVSRFLRIY